MMTLPKSVRRKKRNRQQFVLLALIVIAGITLLGLVYSQAQFVRTANQFLPISLISQLAANYYADNRAIQIPSFGVGMIADTLREREPALDAQARLATVQANLLTPVPQITLTPSVTPTPSPIPTATFTPSPTRTATWTITPSPTPSSTPLPTLTARPTSTPTRTPTAIPSAIITSAVTAPPTSIRTLAPATTAISSTLKQLGITGSIAFHRIDNGIDNISVINLDTLAINAMADTGPVADLIFNTQAPIGTWSPDNLKFAYIYAVTREGPNSLKVLDFKNNTNQSLFASEAGGGLFTPAWSPDSKQIAFTHSDRGTWSLNLINIDGSPCGGKPVCTIRSNNQGEQYHNGLVWSFQGQLALGLNTNLPSDIYTMFSNGTALRNLTNHPADDSVPAWSPDGKQIAFTSTRDGHYQIYVMDVNGENLRRVSHGDATDFSPTWSPDGKWLAFTSVRESGPNIFVMDVNGNQTFRLTINGGDRPAWSH